MDDVYKDIDEHNSKRKKNFWIVFADMIVDIVSNKKFQNVVKELFIRCRKLNICVKLNVYDPILFFCSKRFQINTAQKWSFPLGFLQ